MQQLENEYEGKEGEMAYPHAIHRNAIPHCDVFLDNDYTKEEMKLVNETHKILDPNIRVTATAGKSAELSLPGEGLTLIPSVKLPPPARRFR